MDVRRSARALGALCALLTAGCGSSADTDASTGSDAAAALDAPVDAPSDAPRAACGATAVDVVTGRVTDEAGAAIAGARPQLCARLAPDGRLVCLAPPVSEADGSFSIEVPAEARCMRSAAMRVLLPSSANAVTYCPIELGAAVEGRLALSTPYELFAVERGSLPPLGDPSAAREVPLGAALVLDVSPDAVGGEADYLRLGARSVDPARSCVPEARSLAGLVAATPEASLSAPFRVHAPDLAEGTHVELFVLGGLGTVLGDGTEVEEATLARFGAGTVDAAGWIQPEPGVLLPHLGWLGWAGSAGP